MYCLLNFFHTFTQYTHRIPTSNQIQSQLSVAVTAAYIICQSMIYELKGRLQYLTMHDIHCYV